MFYIKSLPRSDRPVLVDPVRIKLNRRIRFASPGSLDSAQIPTYAQVRAELDGRGAPSERALASVQAGSLPPALAALAQLLDDDVEAGSQQPPEDAEAEDFRGPVEANPSAENAEIKIKQECCKSAPAFVEETATCPDPIAEQDQDHTSYGTVPLKLSVNPERQRTHKNDVPWTKKRFVQGHKVSKTLSKKQREWVDDALLRMKVLLGTGALVCVTMKPKHLDALGPVERMRYWEPFVNNFRSYRKGRCKALKKKLSWWVVRCVWVRESDPDDDLGEHSHWILMFPNAEEADRFIEHVQDTPDYEGWGDNTHAMRIDAEERMVGGKLSSFFQYVLKAVHPQSRFADSTVGWKPSGALVGERYFITRNLKSPEVIAETAAGVATLKRIRAEKKLAAIRRRAREKARQERLYPHDAEPADPALVLAAVEPQPIEADTCLTPGSSGLVHRDQEERRDMDLAEIETRPATATAAIEPEPIPRELDIPAVIDAAPAPILAEVPAPAFVPDTVVSPTAFITPIRASDTMAGFSPVFSGRGFAFRSAAAAVRRSISRGTRAAAGWISSRLFESPGFVAAGAFLGAPDVRPDPW